ncbi:MULTISPECIES: DUF3173 family protein [Streptococcus]|uniref:DUF3173 family protein n=1 Tax=Streptococcus TaxID=1301 RepID=UPI0006181811|nr:MULTISPECIES: DUF3173 family protein [Streptococcus]KKC19642.1 hypothetical protein WH14_05055 [Streptococcus dysgalactiae subsp. equisimilis]MCY7234344.1 DUF3173 family protein [Streptococcus dysgalactiae]QQC49745.1 DUF3173 family protein [Streptococcus dysgalactiae]SUN64897.1 Domain of uncharacterised function (DUF3173) [Streptococcus dysgalactiae subsp. equisimilis]VUC95855.1 Domain of uncharacterised function (DUF3173) [Streptococcus sp. NCTC 11567]
MRDTVNKRDLLKEMSAYRASQVIKLAKEKLIEDGFLFYEKRRSVEIPQEYIYKVLGRKIENG